MSADEGSPDLFERAKRDFKGTFGVVTMQVALMVLKSMLIAWLWNRTIPKLTQRDQYDRPFFRKITWYTALGVLLLLSLLCVRPCPFP